MGDTSAGRVSLVGAGPGDPGLLTMRGAERLREADVVVHDRLASAELLQLAPPEAELVDAGKKPGKPTMLQEEINDVLVDRALAGKRVVRLKGGDPFVFGRGGEEAAACAQAGVRFEVVPGVTSAVSVPAYAGIPVTHRGVATSVTFVTGHEDPERETASVDWSSLAAVPGTLVLMMSVGSLGEICERLIEGGRDVKTPVAAVEWGTLPRQRVVEATLGTMPDAADAADLKPPSIIVVGEVAALRPQLAWFDRRPLWGRRILVTRAREQASTLASRLADEGAEVVVQPLIETAPADPGPMREALDIVAGGGYSWVVFASANGVAFTFEELRSSGRDSRAFAGTRLAAIGEATAGALEDRGIHADLVPATSTSEGIVDDLPLNERGERVLLIRARDGREVMREGLSLRGFDVDEVAAYVTSPVTEAASAVRDLLDSGLVDAAAFASSSTVKNFVDLFGAEAAPPVVACIGPATASTAVELGIEPTVVAEQASVEGLVEALTAALAVQPDA